MPDAAWVALSLAEHIGGKKLRALMAHFGGDPRAILNADAASLRQVPGIGPKIARVIENIDLAAVEAALPRWQAAGITLCALCDPSYPARLAAVDDAPPTLFIRGKLPASTLRAVAIVGTRQPSRKAVETAEQLSMGLAQRGVVIVSGLALGIDRAAHLGALAVGGRTLAVLGSGVLNIYPQANAPLAQAILARGAVISEVNPAAQPNATTLVARNRIISGLSDALIVVESSVEGGAMHAARRALEQGRKVYAVESDASGNRALIAAGAVPLVGYRVDMI